MNDVPEVKPRRGRPQKGQHELVRDQSRAELANLDVWLMVQAKRKLQPSLSAERACELLVREFKKRRAQADDELRELSKSGRPSLPAGQKHEAQPSGGDLTFAARYKEAKNSGDDKWSDAEWFAGVLREFDGHKYLSRTRTLRRCFVRAESLRQDNPFVAEYLAREFERLPGSGSLAPPKPKKRKGTDLPPLRITISGGSIGRRIGQRPIAEVATAEPPSKLSEINTPPSVISKSRD
jgi:hypothetical protein